MTSISRDPSGIPTGGQFASHPKPAAGIALGSPGPAAAIRADRVLEDTRWTTAESKADADAYTAVLTRGADERITLRLDFDSGIASVIDHFDPDPDAPPVAEDYFDVDDPTDAERVGRDLIGRLPAPWPTASPEQAAKDSAALDKLAGFFQSPEWSRAMLEDINELVEATGRPSDVYVTKEDWLAAEDGGPAVTGKPGTAEHDRMTMNSIASYLRQPEWDNGSEALESFAQQVAQSGRDIAGDGVGTWRRH